MFFNLLGGKKVKCKIIDAIYFSEEAKSNAIVNYAKENSSSICIAWFPETFSFYRNLFSAKGLGESRVVEAKFYNDFNHSGKELFCAEHYPLPAKEDEFLQRVQQKSMMVYNSITDPLFKIFGGERIEALMKGMGIKDEEVLTHAMISKSIRKAQEKLAASIPAEQHSSSQAQWFSRNFPEK